MARRSLHSPSKGSFALTAEAVLAAAGQALAHDWRFTGFYRGLLDGPPAKAFACGPRDDRPVDPERAAEVLAGRFRLADAALDIGEGGDPWDRPSPSRHFALALHRFDWLPGLVSLGETGVREALRLVLGWGQTFGGRLTPFVWGPETLERRVLRWACAGRRLAAVASDAETARLAGLLAAQARHLAHLKTPARDAERLVAVCAAAAALAGPAGERLLTRALPRLAAALDEAVLTDGGVKGRSPQRACELLLDLLTLDDALLQRGRDAPEAVARAIDRLTGALRFFTLGDGALAAFQGGEAGDPATVLAARAHEETETRPFGFAPHSGYHRLGTGTLQMMIDAAAPAEGAFSLEACAQPLAIELTAGKDRLFAHPGWSAAASAPAALRLAEGGSTAMLGQGSTGRLLSGFAGRVLGPRLMDGPTRVEARRNESEGGVWLETAHDGWVATTGLLHERRLYLDNKAEELRGEDRFAPAAEAPRTGKSRLIPYAIRFHLHPEVKASVSRDGKSVLLRGPSNRGWRMRNDAAEVALEPSVHFHAGQPRRSLQVVLKGQMHADQGGRVRWKLAPAEETPPT